VENKRIVVSHGDSFAGDICVVHAVNRANLEMKRAAGEWRWRLNPMHFWVSLRDRIMLGGLRFSRYVALSRRVAAELHQYYGVPQDRIVLIPNGVNLERFSPTPDDRSSTRQELQLTKATTVLLFVGHEFERKGLIHAIAALAEPRMEDAVLIVAGSGKIPAFECHARRFGVERRVLFLGPRSDLPRLYRAADAFVFPTGYESFSLTCMEAMACGLPVFATAVGGIEDYLVDGVNGRVIVADGRVIAAALAPMLDDPTLRERYSEGALATARDHGWSRIAERYQALLDDVLISLGKVAYRQRPTTTKIEIRQA
jgi:glycosyltransferase involved in cell wall biosynthesis